MAFDSPRVFVSSVVDGFEEYREAARQAITAAGGEPVLVNENQHAASDSSRNICLDTIETCDIYLAIIGSRGGWVAPSGLTVTEEEYDQARRKNLRILVLVQAVDREENAKRFLDRVSDYVQGHFRVSFVSTDELRERIVDALSPVLRSVGGASVDPVVVTRMVEVSDLRTDRPTLRVAIGPERSEEVISPVTLSTSDFQQAVYELAHSARSPILSYEVEKRRRITSDGILVVEQGTETHAQANLATIEITENGLVAVEKTVDNSPSSNESEAFEASPFLVGTSVVEAALRNILAFVNSLYFKLDPHQRYGHFYFNSSLRHLAYSRLSRDLTPRTSYSLGTGSAECLLAHEFARLITRPALAEPDSEIARVMLRFEQKGQGQ